MKKGTEYGCKTRLKPWLQNPCSQDWMDKRLRQRDGDRERGDRGKREREVCGGGVRENKNKYE